MASDGKNASAERDRTDKSLREEREKMMDGAMAERQTAEAVADKVVRRSRESADAVVNTARNRADEVLKQTAPASKQSAAVVEARLLEDEILQEERDSADESLRLEREESARALRTLLPLERDKTDKNLLTERARYDDAVSNREDFLGIASHDMRLLLGGIVMSAGTIERRVPDSADGKRILVETDRIQRYTARVNRLIGDLVDVARIDAGKLDVRPAQGDATKLISEAVDTFQAAASEKGILLETELIQQYLPIEFDYDRMLQVLANLITNAIKYTYQGGRIRVRGELAEDELRISVSDNGSGVLDEMLPAVFERFWQVGKDDRRGLGLGLYISRCIVEAHGGRIWAESKVGEGSTFRVALPRAADREHRRQPHRDD